MRLLLLLGIVVLTSVALRGASLVSHLTDFQGRVLGAIPALAQERVQATGQETGQETGPPEPVQEEAAVPASAAQNQIPEESVDVSGEVLEQFSDALNNRQALLDSREEQLASREALLKIAEDRLKNREAAIVEQQRKLEELLTSLSDEDAQRLQRLVSIYSNMKPRNAAAIFNELEMETVLPVVKAMLPRKSSPILAEMDPRRARQITAALSELPLEPSLSP